MGQSSIGINPALLLFSLILTAVGGIVYELIIAALSSYLLGNSIYQYSVVIGLYLSAMGLGAYLSRYVTLHLLSVFVAAEIAIGLIGGSVALLLLVFYTYTPIYAEAMYALTIVIGALVGAEIPLLTRIVEEHRQNLRENLARVLGLDYLGSLVGAIAFPLLLYPELGFVKTGFLIGGLNLVVVGVIVWKAGAKVRPLLRGRVGLATAAAAAGVLLVTGFSQGEDVAAYLEQQHYSDHIVWSKDTPYQRIVLTRDRNDVRLYLNGNLQFSSIDERRYHESLVHPVMAAAHPRERILILGGGDGIAAREVLKYDAVREVTLVDLDPAVTHLAETHPALLKINRRSLEDPRVRVVNQDAFLYLQQTQEQYNVIVVDMPDPNNAALAKLYSREFYAMVKDHLSPGGAAVTQSTSPFFARRPFWCIVKTFASVGMHVYPYHVNVPSFGDWGFTLATDRPLDPQRLHLADVPTAYLTDALLPSLFLFGKDIGPIDDLEINTLYRPVLTQYYQAAYNQW